MVLKREGGLLGEECEKVSFFFDTQDENCKSCTMLAASSLMSIIDEFRVISLHGE